MIHTGPNNHREISSARGRKECSHNQENGKKFMKFIGWVFEGENC